MRLSRISTPLVCSSVQLINSQRHKCRLLTSQWGLHSYPPIREVLQRVTVSIVIYSDLRSYELPAGRGQYDPRDEFLSCVVLVAFQNITGVEISRT